MARRNEAWSQESTSNPPEHPLLEVSHAQEGPLIESSSMQHVAGVFLFGPPRLTDFGLQVALGPLPSVSCERLQLQEGYVNDPPPLHA